MSTERFELELLAKEAAFIAGMDRAIKKAAGFDVALEKLTGGQIRFNQAAKRYVDEAGKFVSRTRLQETAVAQLGRAVEQAASAQTKLAGAGAGLATAQTKVAAGAGRGQIALTQLGFALNDAQQFSYGLSTGFRAISNNLVPLAAALGAGGWVTLGVTLAGTAIALFGDQMFKASKDADELKKTLESLAEGLLKIKSAPLIFAERTPDEMEKIRRQLLTQKKAFEEMLAARNTFIRQTGAPGGASGVISSASVLAGGAREEAEFNLSAVSALIDDASKKIVADRAARALATQAEIAGGVVLTRQQRELNEETERQKKLQEDLAFLESPEGAKYRGILAQNQAMETRLGLLTDTGKAQRETDRAARASETARNRAEAEENERAATRARIAAYLLRTAKETAAFLGKSQPLATGVFSGFGQFVRSTDKGGVGLGIRGRQSARGINRPGFRTNALGQEELIPGGLAGGTGGDPEEIASGLAAARAALEAEGYSFINSAVAIKSEIGGVMADFGPSIAGGLASAAADVLSGAASFRQALGGLLTDLGQSLIGMGAAGLAIDAFIKDPFTAIVAGTGLVILGRKLAADSQKKVASFTGRVGGMSASGGIYSGRGGPSYAYNAPAPPQRVQLGATVIGLEGELIKVAIHRVDQRHALVGRTP